MVRGRTVLAFRSFRNAIMWCSTCQQDVPGLGSASAGLRCGKCGQPLAAESLAEPVLLASAQNPGADRAFSANPLRQSPLADADWALDAELRRVHRLLGSLKSSSPAMARSAAHTPHPAPARWHVEREMNAALPAAAGSPDQPQTNLAAWLILSLGVAIFACGAVLLGWSFLAARPDLGPVGMPLALIGQAALILGLVLQLEGLWHSSCSTAQALTQLDGELQTVRQAATSLSTLRTGKSQSFYAQLAEGASPQLLLADLKGQLDLLAQQVAAQKKY
jgi:hypothetical protein